MGGSCAAWRKLGADLPNKGQNVIAENVIAEK
jgi:hypothetical protein